MRRNTIAEVTLTISSGFIKIGAQSRAISAKNDLRSLATYTLVIKMAMGGGEHTMTRMFFAWVSHYTL